MPDLSAYEDELLRQALYLKAVTETLEGLRYRRPLWEQGRDLAFALERVAEYQALVERMLRDLDAGEGQG